MAETRKDEIGSMSYGKSLVRLARLVRGESDQFSDAEVTVLLTGDFSATHRSGDNTDLMATDTMRNTVYALASERPGEPNSELAARLCAHFLAGNPLTAIAEVSLAERRWDRLVRAGVAHPHAFNAGGDELAIAAARQGRDEPPSFSGGVRNLTLLKTTGSAFSGFQRDRYTALAETRDRIMASSMDITWTFAGTEPPDPGLHTELRRLVVDVFADEFSGSVQQTATAIAERLLDTHDRIDEVRLALPNLHYIPFDVARFGVTGDTVFVATTEPHGQINLTVRHPRG